MIRTVRALFLARQLREKALMAALILVIAGLWLSSFAGRAAIFLAERRHTTGLLADQTRWLANRGAVEKAARQAASAFKPEETLDGTRLLAAVQALANSAGLHNFSINQPQDVSTGQFAVHALQFTVNKVDYNSLVSFYSAVRQRAPYVGIEEFRVAADRANPASLNATMKISSVEISRVPP